MELSDIIKIAAIAMSCRNRARALLSDNQHFDDEIFDALIAYTDNVLNTIDVLTEVLEEHYEDLNTTESVLLLHQVKLNIDKSVEIEDFLSQYVSLSVH
jgi:hypothetical protein|tara:strand:+ start:278 stop:574 length:297 start_codon:yes stop_codon:yes gene_type:complete